MTNNHSGPDLQKLEKDLLMIGNAGANGAMISTVNTREINQSDQSRFGASTNIQPDSSIINEARKGNLQSANKNTAAQLTGPS